MTGRDRYRDRDRNRSLCFHTCPNFPRPARRYTSSSSCPKTIFSIPIPIAIPISISIYGIADNSNNSKSERLPAAGRGFTEDLCFGTIRGVRSVTGYTLLHIPLNFAIVPDIDISRFVMYNRVHILACISHKATT